MRDSENEREEGTETEKREFERREFEGERERLSWREKIVKSER